MASTVVVEKVLAKVEEVNKRGKEGTYTAKVVKYNGKEHTVSKDDKDKVKAGVEYNFKLTKSEYNDKLYYWANLIEDKTSPESGSSEQSDEDFKKKVFAYLDGLDKEKKKSVINYLLKKL